MVIHSVTLKQNPPKARSGEQQKINQATKRFQNNFDILSFSGKGEKKSGLRKLAATLLLPLTLAAPNALGQNTDSKITDQPSIEVNNNDAIEIKNGLKCIRQYLTNGGDEITIHQPFYMAKIALNIYGKMIIKFLLDKEVEYNRFFINEETGELVKPLIPQMSDAEFKHFNDIFFNSIRKFKLNVNCT